MKVHLQPYGNRSSSGVQAFAGSPGGLLVQYRSGEAYLYDEIRPGVQHLRTMLELAHAGRGLGTYISRHVRENYAGRFTAEEVIKLLTLAE